MVPRLAPVVALAALSSACGSRDASPSASPPTATAPAPANITPYVLPPASAKTPDDEIFATNGPTSGVIAGPALEALLPSSLGAAPLAHYTDGRYSVAATYQLADGKVATLDLQNTYHRGTHSESLEESNDKSPRLCPKHETLQGADACVTTRLAIASPGTAGGPAETSIRWYLPERIVVHLIAPTDAIARDLARSVPIARIAALSAAP